MGSRTKTIQYLYDAVGNYRALIDHDGGASHTRTTRSNTSRRCRAPQRVALPPLMCVLSCIVVPSAMLCSGRVCNAATDVEGVLAAAESAASEMPANERSSYLVLVADGYACAGLFDRCRATIAAIADDDQRQEAYAVLTAYLAGADRFADAEAAAESAGVHADRAQAALALGYARSGQWEQAVERLSLIRRRGQRGLAALAVSVLYSQAGRRADAEGLIREAERNVSDGTGYPFAVEAWLAAGKPEVAQTAVARFVRAAEGADGQRATDVDYDLSELCEVFARYGQYDIALHWAARIADWIWRGRALRAIAAAAFADRDVAVLQRMLLRFKADDSYASWSREAVRWTLELLVDNRNWVAAEELANAAPNAVERAAILARVSASLAYSMEQERARLLLNEATADIDVRTVVGEQGEQQRRSGIDSLLEIAAAALACRDAEGEAKWLEAAEAWYYKDPDVDDLRDGLVRKLSGALMRGGSARRAGAVVERARRTLDVMGRSLSGDEVSQCKVELAVALARVGRRDEALRAADESLERSTQVAMYSALCEDEIDTQAEDAIEAPLWIGQIAVASVRGTIQICRAKAMLRRSGTDCDKPFRMMPDSPVLGFP
jgi:tetratricopeptide (TPR) repeat protein